MIILAKSTESMSICKDINDFDNVSSTTESLKRLNHSSLTAISSNMTIPINGSTPTKESNEVITSDDYDCSSYDSFESYYDSESPAVTKATPSGTMTIFGCTALLNAALLLLSTISLYQMLNDLNILLY